MDFEKFSKIPRLSRECIITEKIDGTNGQIFIGEDGEFKVGSRNRWLYETKDNFGFHKWALENQEELMKLGPGRHYGEWWGEGIQRRYGIKGKRFSLFNVGIWNTETLPKCCHVVPELFTGAFTTENVEMVIKRLEALGSQASPGFMKPEGIIIWHTASRGYFKKTIEGDEKPKTQIK